MESRGLLECKAIVEANMLGRESKFTAPILLVSCMGKHACYRGMHS